MTMTRALVAEFVGTFALMFVGGGSIVITAALPGDSADLLIVAMAHGLVLATMVSATMHLSGGQLNPAVSIGLAVIRKQSWLQAMTFVASQCVASLTAAGLLKGLFSSVMLADATQPAVDAVQVGATLGSMNLAAGPVFVLEMIATYLLMFSVMGTAVDQRGVGRTMAVGGIAIGLTVAAGILCIGPATGASMNPARSFGPALVAGAWDMHWVYWLGPIAGAVACATMYRTVFGLSDGEPQARD